MKLFNITKAFLYMSICFIAKLFAPSSGADKKTYERDKHLFENMAVDAIGKHKYHTRNK